MFILSSKTKIFMLSALLAGFGCFFLLSLGHALSVSTNAPVAVPSDLRFERITLNHVDDKTTVALFLKGDSAKAFILAHGNGGNRTSLIARAQFLHELGYSVILPDLHGHGETIGGRKTFGIREAWDIENAYFYLKHRHNIEWIGGLGTSLGGAALLKAAENGLAFDALIIESVFANIRVATRHRLEMSFGPLARILEPLLTWQIPLWLGKAPGAINPAKWAKACYAPTLVLSGSDDQRARSWEAHAIFENLASENKQIHIFAGARHQSLFYFNRRHYTHRVTSFLAKIK